MGQNPIRLLKASEIECRVSVVNANGASLLLYKDARVDQRILDETFGAFGWRRSHQCIDGNLYCTVEVRDPKTGEWVSKQDVGTTGYTEKEKSQASDSFKRACFNWGIGRELYSAPFIWVPAGRTEIRSRENKFYCNDRFSVASIRYGEDREITGLSIINGKGEMVFEMKPDKAETAVSSGSQPDSLSKEQMASLQAELDRTGVTMESVQSRYRVQKPEAMSEELYQKVMRALKRTKSVDAA